MTWFEDEIGKIESKFPHYGESHLTLLHTTLGGTMTSCLELELQTDENWKEDKYSHIRLGAKGAQELIEALQKGIELLGNDKFDKFDPQ